MAHQRPELAQHREAMGFSKVGLAKAMGVDRGTVHRWESGESAPRAETRPKLARVLQLSLRELEGLLSVSAQAPRTTNEVVSLSTVDSEQAGADNVDRRQFIQGLAATGFGAVLAPTRSDAPQLVASLEASVQRAVRFEQRSQYAALGAILPGLVADAERIMASTSGGLWLHTARHLATAQMVKAFVLIKLDRPLDAQAVAAEALKVAQTTNDQVLIGTALRCLGETYMRGNTYDLAAELSIEGAICATRGGQTDADAMAVQGAGLLSAASASARSGDRSSAMELLEAADQTANELRHDYLGGVIFGPTNVAIHRVAFEVELGDPVAALRYADDYTFHQRPGMDERQARYLLDVARAQASVGKSRDAVSTLLHAESIAAEEIRTHRHSRAVLADLIANNRAGVSMELRPLALRCNAKVDL